MVRSWVRGARALLVFCFAVSCSSGESEGGDPAGLGGPTDGTPPPNGDTMLPGGTTPGQTPTTPGEVPGGPTDPSAGAAGAGAVPPVTPAPGMVELPAEYYGEVISPAAIAPECQGFKLDGLRYSPGGETLPNKCEPFDATTNNPYAVRCIDAWSHYQTSFPGDELCILPPPPDKGVQIGTHPQGPAWFAQAAAGDLSGYQNVNPEWTLEAGQEETINFRSGSDNTSEQKYYRIYYRMRSGSHHNIITSHTSTAPKEVWIPGSTLPGAIDPFLGPLVTSLGGAQRPDDSHPQTFEKPAEDEGLYNVFPVGAAIVFNMHHFNFTDGPILKESWNNYWWEENATTKVEGMFALELGQVLMTMPANTTRDLHYFWTLQQPVRIVSLFGHRHSWTPNFSAWIERQGSGTPELIYQSFDWFDVPTYHYDSITQNPAPNPEAKIDGAYSGLLELEPGDELHFNCRIAFTDARAAQVAAGPSASEIGTLRFANEAYDAEMCILFGGTAHYDLPGPQIGSAADVPDFAKVE